MAGKPHQTSGKAFLAATGLALAAAGSSPGITRPGKPRRTHVLQRGLITLSMHCLWSP
jgi:hypothetical protein